MASRGGDAYNLLYRIFGPENADVYAASGIYGMHEVDWENEHDYHPLYLEGIKYFNICDFFESHESWEELWTDYRGPSRKFFQGLIQAAVALFHFGNGNIRGAKKLYHSSRDYLDPYRPRHRGIDLDAFLNQFDQCFTEVAACDAETFPQIDLNPELIPEIHLDPPAPEGVS